MKFNDPLYGKFEITEPVLLDLLNIKALKRLQGVSSAGYYPAYPEYFHPRFDKYNHSIGVFLLLRKFNASLEEQIAGLIHDVSHTAFSHTIDYIEDDKENQKDHSTQDKNHNEIVYNSEIPAILKHHNIDIEYILEEENFPLKEKDLPDICADRIDYSLRQFYETRNFISEKEKDFLLNNLAIFDNQFVFKNFDSAKLFADLFWDIDEDDWSAIKSGVMFSISGKLFGHAINKGYVAKDKFFTSHDKEIIDLIAQKRGDDKAIHRFMSLLEKPTDCFENAKREMKDDENYIGHVYCKVRKVNPYFIQDNSLKRISDVDNEFKVKMSNTPKFKEYFVRVKDGHI